MTPLTALLALILLATPSAFALPPGAEAGAEPVPARSARAPDAAWPVRAAAGAARPLLLRGFAPPPEPWAAGHRGVDLATVAGAPVRAAVAGRVSFAGPVAGRGVVSVTPEDGLGAAQDRRVTYEPVVASVAVGERVAAGEVIGAVTAGPYHCPAACLHWGLRQGERYLDPLSLLPPALLGRGPSRLLPTLGVPVPGAAGQAAVSR